MKKFLSTILLFSIVGCVNNEKYITEEYCMKCNQILDGFLTDKSVICLESNEYFDNLRWISCNTGDSCYEVCNENMCVGVEITEECQSCVINYSPKEYNSCVDDSR